MERSLTRWVCLLAVLALVLAACGSSSTKSKKKSTPKPAACASDPGKQTMTATPCAALTDGQTVKVEAKGFTPNKQNIGITECANKGDQTQAADCNLRASATAIPDANGKITTDFKVYKSFNDGTVTCGTPVPCLVSVSELAVSPTEVTSRDLAFG